MIFNKNFAMFVRSDKWDQADNTFLPSNLMSTLFKEQGKDDNGAINN